MGRLIVFEETGEVRPAKPGELFQQGYGVAWAVEKIPRNEMILRRLTDEEVAKLVALQPADDERGRFVRECAMRLFLNIEARCVATGMAEGEWESRRDEFANTAIADAAALAARLWEKK